MTLAGNLCRASLSDVCGWVKRAWNKIPDEMIIELFKTCKISTWFGSDDETDEDGEINEDEISEDDRSENEIEGGNYTSEDDGSSGVWNKISNYHSYNNKPFFNNLNSVYIGIEKMYRNTESVFFPE